MPAASGIQPEPAFADAPRKPWPLWATIALSAAALLVAGMLVWQGITSGGSPDPLKPETKSLPACLDIAVLVFREGLECILVLSAIMASMVGSQSAQRRPVAVGAGFGFLATVVTWFIAVGILDSLTESVSALHLQAATGLLAIVVLLVVMNWFFHKMYWGGWIGLHARKKKELVKDAGQNLIGGRSLLIGLGLLGFSSFYREGFEIVLFLQSYRLKLGSDIVLLGTVFGGVLTAIVAVLTFAAHRRLPYRKMLVLTGIMLGAVLLVMVGEQAQEMQLAHWLSETKLPALSSLTPPWTGVWFGIYPTVETLAAQGLAAVIVIGSYFLAGRRPAPNAAYPDETPANGARVCD